MMIRIFRKLPRHQLLKEYAAEHGSPNRITKTAKRNPSKRALLEEWLHHLSQKDLDEEVTLEHDLVFHDPDEFLRAWTPQRLAMYQYLKTHPDVDSLNQLAKRLHRNYRNVYEDAHRLAGINVLALERHANSLAPKALADEVTVTV